MEGYANNHWLYKTLKTTKSILHERLRVEMSTLWEMCEKTELSIHWIEKQYQLSDVLTKKGASHQSLIETLQKGKIE